MPELLMKLTLRNELHRRLTQIAQEPQHNSPDRSQPHSPTDPTSQHFLELGNLAYAQGAGPDELQLPVHGHPELYVDSSPGIIATPVDLARHRSKRKRIESPCTFGYHQIDAAELQPSMMSGTVKIDTGSILTTTAPPYWVDSGNMLNDAWTPPQVSSHWLGCGSSVNCSYEHQAQMLQMHQPVTTPYTDERMPAVWPQPAPSHAEEEFGQHRPSYNIDQQLEKNFYPVENQVSAPMLGHYEECPFIPPASYISNLPLNLFEQTDTKVTYSQQQKPQAQISENITAPTTLAHFDNSFSFSYLPVGAHPPVPIYPNPTTLVSPTPGFKPGFPIGQEVGSFAPCEIVSCIQRGSKRGPFKDPLLRERTAMTRKIGCCIRCRIQRVRCEPDEQGVPGAPCATCQKVTNARTASLPCMRSKISDVKVGKPGQVPGYQWSRRWNHNISDTIQEWASTEVKTVHVSDIHGLGFFKLPVRQFVPQAGDKLERSWDYNGTRRSVAVPAYALVNLYDGKVAYNQYLNTCQDEDFSGRLNSRDEFFRITYREARSLMNRTQDRKKRDLLSRTFKLWMAVRLSTSSEFIVGEETLGMPEDILDDTNPNRGRIPVPPVLGAQLDVILIHHIQARLKREALGLLNEIVLNNKPKNWYCIYLVIFILLHNAAMITAHDAGYAKKHGMKRRFAREAEVHGYADGANTLLAHFHYLNKGSLPFSDSCSISDLQTLGQLDSAEVDFVMMTRRYANQHARSWARIREEQRYEDDYYFVSQLFEEKWHPKALSI